MILELGILSFIELVVYFIVFLLWIYADSPDPFRSNATELSTFVSTKRKIFNKDAIVYKPWVNALGIMKMNIIALKEWLELDRDTESEIGLVESYTSSDFTFLVSKKYE